MRALVWNEGEHLIMLMRVQSVGKEYRKMDGSPLATRQGLGGPGEVPWRFKDLTRVHNWVPKFLRPPDQSTVMIRLGDVRLLDVKEEHKEPARGEILSLAPLPPHEHAPKVGETPERAEARHALETLRYDRATYEGTIRSRAMTRHWEKDKGVDWAKWLPPIVIILSIVLGIIAVARIPVLGG